MRRRRSRPAVKRSFHPRTAVPGVLTFDEIRRVALTFPGVEVGTSYGTPALKVRGKLLARLHQTEEALVLRTDFIDRQILMQSAPDTFYITDHYLDHPWILVRLSSVKSNALPDLIKRAWRLVAPKALTARFDME